MGNRVKLMVATTPFYGYIKGCPWARKKTGTPLDKMNPDLQKERDEATFDTEKLSEFIFLGKDLLARKRYLERVATTDPAFRREPITSMSREEAYDEGVRTAVLFPQKMKEYNIGLDRIETYLFRNAVLPNYLLPTQLHTLMFIPILKAQSTDEQFKYWSDRMEHGDILGTYAQTELGHGTFLRGLETTATYDEATQEFVLHTPTLSSMKWWPGGMGKTANHAIVMAQIYTKDKCHGVHPFIVQLRDIETHKSLPGLTMGDIGSKIGYPTVDNGYLRLEHYRIPREHLLMKHAQVSVDGVYTRKSSDKVVYGGMVMVRATMLGMLAVYLAQAATIAVRYSAVRRQSEITPGAGEVQVIDFITQQDRILPALATAYALLLSSRNMMNHYMDVQQDMADGDFSLLEQLHSSSSGLKAFCTWRTLELLEVCRQACGGHGYLNSSGMTKLFSEMTGAVTYEGDNVVMILQSARLLMKFCDRVKKGETLTGLVAYLNNDLAAKSHIRGDRCDIGQLLAAAEHRAARMLIEASNRLRASIRAGNPPSIAWNITSVAMSKAALAHCELYSMRSFIDVLKAEDVDPNVMAALNSLCKLYLVHSILRNLGDYTLDGYISKSQASLLQTEYESLLGKVRVNAVAFVDALDFPDKILESDLGRWDGHVYEAMYRTAQKSSLNKTDVHPVFHKYIKPMMDTVKKASKL